MVYTAFVSNVTRKLKETLGESCQLSVQPLRKNNGVTLDGLMIRESDSRVSPAIYLNPYYEQYKKGLSMEEIISDILNLYHAAPLPSGITEESFADTPENRQRIMFRLIHTASNQSLLTDLPHIPYLDLSIVFYLFLESNHAGQMTALIHNDHMTQWKLSLTDLWKLACENTPQRYPAQIRSMPEMMQEIARHHMGERYEESLVDSLFEESDDNLPLYVLTNQNSLYGAGCILYPDILKNFANALGQDLIILPSSIHEVLLTPDGPEVSYEELSAMVTTINRQDVALEDQLSNQVYLYNRKSDQIRIVSHGPGSIGASACN